MSAVAQQMSSRRRPEDPAAHRGDVDLVAAVDVDGQLRLRGRPRRREDVRGLVGLHLHVGAIAALARGEEVGPVQLRRADAVRRRCGAATEHDDAFDGARVITQGGVDDRARGRRRCPCGRSGRRQSRPPRAARPDPVGERAVPEAGEDHRVDRPDAQDGREHRDDRLGGRRQVDRQPVAATDAQRPQGRRRSARPRQAAPRRSGNVGRRARRWRSGPPGRRSPSDLVVERVPGEVRAPARRTSGRSAAQARRPGPSGGTTAARRRPRPRTPPDRRSQPPEVRQADGTPSSLDGTPSPGRLTP